MIAIILLMGCKGPSIGVDSDSSVATDDSTVTADDSSPSVDYPPLIINEFMASNSSGVQDASGAYPDWIELYNPNPDAIELTGWTITDDLSEPDKHAFDSLSIDAGGWLLLYADDDEEDGPDHVGFSLSAGGEEIGIFDPGGQVQDSISYGEQTTDHSAARTSDGGSSWETTDSPTPGASNG